MTRVSRWLVGIILICLIVGALIVFGLPRLNRYEKDGTLVLSGLTRPVTVIRDEKGMPYIRGGNLDDVVMAQGFATAQDRLFQMNLTRLVATGRISELAGDKGKSLDIQMRTIGIHRNAKKHAEILDEETKRFFQKYADGVNAFMKTCPDSLPMEFKLAGIQPEPWAVSDTLAVVYFMGWITSANVKSEIIAQMLVEKVGLDRARQIFSVNINPDDPTDQGDAAKTSRRGPTGLQFCSDASIVPYCKGFGHGLGSNNWAVSSRLSPHGKPVVADDPHLDSRILPGVWYPCGLITPELRAVGVTLPGIPGMIIGRTDHVALGVTNAYGDCQDLYVETLDPKDTGRYLEGTDSLPFKVIEEKLRIKDKDAPGGFREETLKIRLTKRGPVVSDALPGLRTNNVITLRWAAAESMGPKLGLKDVLKARSGDEFRDAVKQMNFVVLNFVFGDVQGNIGWHVSGKLPIRSQRDSTVPYTVKDGKDNWIGWIPFNDMPHDKNPRKGWLGTCNHKTVANDYPYYYSSFFAPSYRYRRLKEILNGGGVKSVDDHWRFQRDTTNLMAKAIAPVMAQALLDNKDTEQMGKILVGWNFRDDPDKAAPTVFQYVYRNFAQRVFQDELGTDLADTMLEMGYFWQERLQRMVLEGSSRWFDNTLTKDKTETMNDLFQQAALDAAKEMKARFGNNPVDWQWGEAHQIEFVNPLRRKGFGKSLLSSGSFPMGGSRETLYCAWFDYAKPFDVILSASLRMVADLGDDDKVMAVLPGGVSGRTFDPHMKDQVKPFMNGDKVYWWFSDQAIDRHAKSTLTLKPAGD